MLAVQGDSNGTGVTASIHPTPKRADWFGHYAKPFNTVELNAPFYAWPTVRNVTTWKTQTGSRRFLYTVKVNELITHIRRFSRTTELIKDFGHIAEILGPAMGCFLFQFPPSFRYSPARLATWWSSATKAGGTLGC